ncbi:alkaline phosphatase family protein [Puia dinghuensis]|uniref:Alkaline phosphatase family protein n=1 Tax=Puia dinghuensis TaxID=1792502 RepID=A0A8J2XSN5_9BACT|nr:ectonucleotide pyrophosphatase/phosphodiesterase [Puia dinghuensis]GGA97052.1 alkaline phosphatase family protein [Puia dinghuensis]
MRFYLLLALFFTTAGLSAQITDSTQKMIPGRSNSPEQEQKPYVIFISADGFRYDLADKYQATRLQALRAKGVQATAMTPSYPSVTFPNHYSLATGLYPSHHGLVDNTFFDMQKGRGYTIRDRAAVEDPYFYGGTPIWVLAEQQQMLTASFFWVGSETAIDDIRPTYYYRFNDRISIDTRLQAVKDWLTLPEAQRPHLITFYLSWVDHAEHLHGPNSAEAEEAVHQVDNAIDRLTRIVDSLHLPVNYVFVSDHGMAQVDTTHGITPPAIDTSKFIVSYGGTMIHLYAKDKKDIAPTYAALKATAKDYYVYLPNETPAYWHYREKDDHYHRIGDVLLVAHFPLIFHSGGHMIAGEHGYDNAIPDMGATFYAWGPAFRQGMAISPFENVNVYPLIAHILGLKITQPIDGSLKVLSNTLSK